MRSRYLLSIVLAGLLVLANIVCGCPGGTDRVSDDANPHSHHQMQDGSADGENALCSHQECEDCESIAIGATPDRDAKLASFIKIQFDDEVEWIEHPPMDISAAPLLLARASPRVRRSLRFAESPVRRADLLLE